MKQMSSGSLCLSPRTIRLPLPSKFHSRPTRVSARTSDSPTPTNDYRSINLSVLRFTLGIPGLDESYMPRWIRVRFPTAAAAEPLRRFGSFQPDPCPTEDRSFGSFYSSISVVLPYPGKFLPLISAGEAFCIRGYWRTPTDVLKDGLPNWFEKQDLKTSMHDSAETLHFPQSTDFGWDFLPKGARSLLVQPLLQDSDYDMQMTGKNEGFLILASSIEYAYNEKDRAWIQAVANKFRASILW